MHSSKAYKNLNPVFSIFLFDSENPKFGISSLVSLKIIFGLYFLHISATSFTVTVSFDKLNNSFGVLMDDIIAGLISGIIVYFFYAFY